MYCCKTLSSLFAQLIVWIDLQTLSITLDKRLSSPVRKVKSGLERIFGKSEKEVRLYL